MRIELDEDTTRERLTHYMAETPVVRGLHEMASDRCLHSPSSS